MSTLNAVTLWRADRAGLAEVADRNVWTYWAIDRAYAEWYKNECLSRGLGHMSIYRALVIIEPAETLDLGDLGDVGEDHDSIRYTFDDDGECTGSNPQLVEASECDIRWVTWRCPHPCCAAPIIQAGEFLYIGTEPIPVEEGEE
jgi:hypothetical protein